MTILLEQPILSTELVYPESDGQPMAETDTHRKLLMDTISTLEEFYREDARVYVRGFVRCLAAEIGLDKEVVSRTYVPRWESWFYDHNNSPR